MRFFDLGKGQASDNILFCRNGNSNELFLQVYNGSSAGGSVSTSGGALELNKWQYIAATIGADGSAVIYKNGRAIASGTVNVPNNLVRTSNFIGNSNWAGETPFTGSIDEAAI